MLDGIHTEAANTSIPQGGKIVRLNILDLFALGVEVPLRRYLYLEGLCLLALTLPFIALFAINMVATDAIDTYRLPFTTGRFAISFGITYLMMSGMICLGIWLPVRKVTRMVPAEALHYE